MRGLALPLLAALVLAISASFAAVACDPVRSDAVAALGPEAPGVRRGPLHRPGQPCLLCHDGGIGDPEAFSVAGTVYPQPSSTQGMSDVLVHMIDVSGSTYEATTNTAGNFYVLPRQWTPHYPVVVTVTAPGGDAVPMHTFIQRDGSCGGCHVAPAGPDSPGHVCITLDDGGTPP